MKLEILYLGIEPPRPHGRVAGPSARPHLEAVGSPPALWFHSANFVGRRHTICVGRPVPAACYGELLHFLQEAPTVTIAAATRGGPIDVVL